MKKTTTQKRGLNRKTATALKNFKSGFNCAQAVLSAYGRELGLRTELGHRVSQSFGAGMARLAGTCGAVTGGLMVIGLKHGKTRAKDDASKERTYALAQELFRRFRRRHGSLTCLGLLGHHIGTARGQKVLKQTRAHDVRCPRYVHDVIVILEKIL